MVGEGGEEEQAGDGGEVGEGEEKGLCAGWKGEGGGVGGQVEEGDEVA